MGTLCVSDKINKWAKYKPEIINQPDSISLEQRKSNNFGLVSDKTYNSRSELLTAVKNGSFTGGWSYNRPTGTAWKRLDDFVGYNHKAKAPFGALRKFEGVLSSNTLAQLLIPCEAPEVDPDPSSDSGILNIKDFSNTTNDYKNWYFGILLYQSDSRYFMATTTSPIGTAQDWQVNFGWINPSYAGTYKGVPFLSSKPYTVNGSEPSGVRIVGVGQGSIDVILKSTSQLYDLFASVMYSDDYSNQVNYMVSLRNLNTTGHTFANVGLEVAIDANGKQSTTLKNFGSVTVAAGKTWIIEGTASVSSREYNFFRPSASDIPVKTWAQFEERDMGDYQPG